MKRTYTANVINKEGKLVGSLVYRVLFWVSPIRVHGEMGSDVPNGYIVDFKKL